MSNDPNRVQDVFAAIVELPAALRAASLERECGSDVELRQRVEALLKARDESGNFVHHPAGQVKFSDVLPAGDQVRWVDPAAVASPSESTQAVPDQSGAAADVWIGPYKLLQKLGEGGMGTVWAAEQTQPVKRRVAIKVIKPGMDSAQVIRRFEAERQALALMDHSHIAKVLDGGTTPQGRPFFVMELVKGVPITRYCDELNLPVRERLELFTPVCQAIQHAHQKGIIHRDIKPSNVLVAIQDGKPLAKVIDFGVAKALHQRLADRSMYTEIGAVIGTLEYMSPEQAELSALDIDTRADVYALGVLLYELLTGTTPLDRERLKNAALTEMLRIIREVEPPKPSTRLSESKQSLASLAAQRRTEPARLAKQVRGELDWIVMRCLEKDRTRRYESASALARDIEHYLHDEAVEASPPSARYRLRKFLRRNKTPVLAVSLVLLALLGGILGTTWGLFEANQSRLLAEENERQARRAAVAEADAKKDALNQKAKAVAEGKRAVAAERLAKAEAAVAEAVNDFLQRDLLGQADVAQQHVGDNEGRDPDVTVRTLLDRAAKTLDGKFPEQPLTEAAIRQTVGSTYQALGDYAEAQRHLERALQLRTAQLGADDQATLKSKADVADLYADQGNYDRAEQLFHEALPVQTATLGADHSDTLTSKFHLADLCKRQGKFDQAEALLNEALQAQTKTLGADHDDTLSTKQHLAMLYVQKYEYNLAEPLLNEVLEKQAAKLGADHPITLGLKEGLAQIYQHQAKYDQAETLMKDVLQTATARLGSRRQTLAVANNLAALYEDQGKYDQAETLYLEVLQAVAAKLGADHPDALIVKHNLATLYHRQGKYDRAEPLAKEVLEKQSAKLGAGHPATLISEAALVDLYKAQKKYDQAEALLQAALQAQAGNPAGDYDAAVARKHNLAELYRLQGKYDQAETLFKEVLEKQTAKPQSYDDQSWIAKSNLALLYSAQRKYVLAEPLFKEVLAGQTAKLGAEHPVTLTTKHNLAAMYRAQGKYDQAETLFKEVLAGRTARLGADHPDTLSNMQELALVYRLQGKYDRAEPLFREMLQAQRARPDGADTLTFRLAIENLMALYEDQGKFDRAEPLRREFADSERQRLGPDSPGYARELVWLGQNLLRQKKFADAEPVFRDSLVILQNKQPDDSWTFNAQSMLGESLAGQQKFAEAEPLLLTAYQGIKQREARLTNPNKFYIIAAMQRLVELYAALDQPDDAAKWTAELIKYRSDEKPKK